MDYIREQIETIRHTIRSCAERLGRDPSEITLMAVSKNHSVDKVVYARDICDVHCFGENRVQEAQQKFSGLQIPDELHIIGHLQTNKVKKAVEISDHIDSVDSLKLLEKIEQAAAGYDKTVNILLEYNTSGEAAKTGFNTPEELFQAIEAGIGCKHLVLKGLMTIGPLTDDTDVVRAAFRQLKELYLASIKQFPEIPFDTLSMGMSSDFEIAIEEGSTLVRVGTAIFGARTYD
ncbi:MAG: YggS family pyridoxal phosphate-dependent enzyme [Spirochaetia bacterium]|nr:YggS family pyridoxal phosphate-dependent enzyme [Spirochaetia bacterium]MCF7941010.1 YggS family pyridoxal phosphate-dependent enzyme [Spirochaetia bacterium]